MERVPPWVPVLLGPLVPVVFWWLALPVWVDEPKVWARQAAVVALHAILAYGIALLVPSRLGRTVALGLAGAWLALLVVVKAGFFHLYGSTLTPGAFHVVRETNLHETGDFLRVQMDAVLAGLLAGAGVWWAVQVVAAWRAGAALGKAVRRGGWRLHVGVVLGAAGCLVLLGTRLRTSDPVSLGLDAWRRYGELHAAFGTRLATPFNTGLREVAWEGGAELGVVVIGESTSARHLGLQGYWRNTTPALGAIRDELLIFRDVVSPHSHTIASLTKVLTLASHEHPDAATEGSVIQLANAAGFATSWISNQRPVGINETLVTALSRAAGDSRFVGMLSPGSVVHDEVVLPPLREVLESSGARQIVFVHLMGTHQDYASRYPRAFQHFEGQPRTPFPSPRSREAINAYDNAVRYWDHVCRRIIEVVRATGRPAFVVLLSDHGEDVFQEMDGMGHSEERGTAPMFEVPFILWRSQGLAEGTAQAREVLEARPWALEDFGHAFAEIAGIRFAGHDPTRSVVGDHFQPRPRRVGLAGRDPDAP